ncbi:MAG: hypothetical protein D6815_03475 [Candidatus Dadabacteria bacterium]|nr:MAG: hypothetical protein D6815_03475 [Candidatus Dadabacteria bacterium]
MRRLLQIVSALLAALALALAWRLVQVLRVKPPVFAEVRQVPRIDPLPPPPRRPTPPGSAIDAIVDGNLFEVERGQKPPQQHEETAETPLPPPTNVVLHGVFVREGEPMAILTDAAGGNKQLTVRVGDSVGDYEVGEIERDRVTLLGRGGQRFLLQLDIHKGGAVKSAVGPPGARPRPTPGTVRTPAQARAEAVQRAAQARRTTAAQRAAAARARAAQNRTPQVAKPPDPTQQRLEALKRLREAAQAR